MLKIMKSNFLQYWRLEMVFIPILISGSYLAIDMPIIMLSFIVFPAFMTDIFYYEKKTSAYRFFVSLPINEKTIVQSRYLFFLFCLLIMTLYQWLTVYSIERFIGGTDYIYTWKTALVAFGLGLTIASVILPFFYLLRSVYIAICMMLIIILIFLVASLEPLVTALNMTDYISFNHVDRGYIILAEKYLPYAPFLLFLIVSCVLYYFSSELSTRFFVRKDK